MADTSNSAVPVIAPDGTKWDIPHEQVPSAIQNGGKLGVDMIGPDDKPYLIPMDNVHAAIQSGGRLAPPGISKPTAPPMQTSVLGKAYDTLQNGPGGGQPLPNPKLAGSTGIAENTAKDTIPNRLAVGALKGSLQAVHTVGAVIPGSGVPFQEPKSLQPEGTAEHIGAGLEGIAEFASGDELLRGASIAERFGIVAKLAKIAESHPFAAKIISTGLSALRQGTVGTGQSVAHGASPSDAAITGVTTGGLSLGLGAVGDVASELKPGVKEIAGTKIPARASQSSAIARAAEDVANPSSLEKFDVQQTQPAAKRAIGNIATEIRNAALEKRPVSLSTPTQPLPEVSSLKEAAQSLKNEAQPVFQKLDDLTANEEMKFSDWQKTERSALRRGDYEQAAKARGQQEALMSKYANEFDANDLSNARANWSQARNLEDLDKKLSTKSILQPTPEELRLSNAPDPGYINGKQFGKQILALRNNGSLRAAGLTSEHIQSLQNIGTILERGNVSPSSMSQILQFAGKVSKKVSGAQYVVSRLMTSPTFATKVEGALKSPTAIAAGSNVVRSLFSSDSESQNDDDQEQPASSGKASSRGASALGGRGNL